MPRNNEILKRRGVSLGKTVNTNMRSGSLT